MDENKNDTEILGSPLAPYINNTLIPNSADFTHFVAETHPSQPNYLELFSGSNQDVFTDNTSPLTPFTTPNLGRELLNAGKSFDMYSENLPSTGFTGDASSSDPTLNEYVRKHNPAVNWQDDSATASANALPSSVNVSFSQFPTTAAGYADLPAFSFVVPNEQDDMHDGSITEGDTWLANNMEAYRQWAQTHDSLLIFTFDESDMGELAADPNNQIITTISGQGIVDGKYDEAAIARFHLSNAAAPDTAINHYNLLKTIEDIEGTANDASNVAAFNSQTDVEPITDIFARPAAVPEASTWVPFTLGAGVLALLLMRRRKTTPQTTTL